MIESLVSLAYDLPVWGIILATFVIAYIENLVPPAPSDVLLVFVGTLCGIGLVDFTTTLVVATVGSVSGFASAYWIGRHYGRAMIEKGWLPFISMQLLDKVEAWFDKYHGWIIVGNRFLAGTRAVISFAAGMTKMPFLRTTVLCAISALAWNAILILLGMQFGSRWREVDAFLSVYGWVVLIVLTIAILIWILVKRRNKP